MFQLGIVIFSCWSPFFLLQIVQSNVIPWLFCTLDLMLWSFQNWYCHISHTMTRQRKVVSCGLPSLLPPDISSVLEKSLPHSEFSLSYVLLLTFTTFNNIADVFIIASVMFVKLNWCCVCCWFHWLLYFDIWTDRTWFVALKHSIFNPCWSITRWRGNPCSN